MKSLRHAVTILVLLLAAAAGGLFALILGMARRVVVPKPREMDTKILSVDTGAQTIELARNPDTELPGRYGLFTSGTHGYLKLGAVLGADAHRVRRKLLTEVGPGAQVGADAAFSGWYYSTPAELHLPWQNVLIGSPSGPCPAWFFPAETDSEVSDTWIIQVHGRGSTRGDCLRAVPVFHRLGHPNLVVSYRNDGDGPRTRAGAYALGSAEWRDVDAAIGYALRHGARRVVLMGWSMGGAISLQALLNSGHRAAIAGLVLESPVVDWREVLRFQSGELGLREPLPSLTMRALSDRRIARWGGADDAIPFDDLDIVARADELTVPILLLHSDDDGYVPADASHRLAEARPDIVTMPRFAVARHTKLWNYDQSTWTAAINDWMRAQGFSASA